MDTSYYIHLTDPEKEGVKRFVAAVKDSLDENLISLRLFGSKARGDFDVESDIDILLIVKEKDWDLYYRVCGIANDMALEFGAEISPVILTKAEFNLNKAHNTLFYENVEKEGIPV